MNQINVEKNYKIQTKKFKILPRNKIIYQKIMKKFNQKKRNYYMKNKIQNGIFGTTKVRTKKTKIL